MRTLLTFLLPLALAAPALAAPAEPFDAAEVMRRAADVYAKEVRGIVAFEALAETRLRSSVFNRDGRSHMWVVMRDGLSVQAKVLALTSDGKPNEGDRKKLEARTNESFKSGKGIFKAPYDPRHRADYLFDEAPNEAIGPGETAIAFASTTAKQDEHHGTGTLVLTASGHVRHVRYRPSVMPDRVKTGEVVMERGAVAPGLWGNRLLKMAFEGGIGPMSGAFSLTQRFENYRRFTSVEAALAAAPAVR